MYYYYSYVYLAIFVCIIYEHVVYDSMYMLLIALTGPHWLVHLCIVMYDSVRSQTFPVVHIL